MNQNLYAFRHIPIIGFHGCDKQVAEAVVTGKVMLNPSANDYDWLGPGVYFWENNLERAWQWAKEAANRKGSNVRVPAVLGAIIELGYCLDLLDSQCIEDLKSAYSDLVKHLTLLGEPLPKNAYVGNSEDHVLRRLDCAVIQTAHKASREANGRPYDSVRSMFLEGGRLYEQSGFAEKNHVQVCVCNPNCVKGYFLPRSIDTDYPLP